MMTMEVGMPRAIKWKKDYTVLYLPTLGTETRGWHYKKASSNSN